LKLKELNQIIHFRLARLLFVAHRQEILEQAQVTFRNVLRDQNFGELQVGQFQANRLEHLFCSVHKPVFAFHFHSVQVNSEIQPVLHTL